MNNNLYITGLGGASCNETWTWSVLSGWTRVADITIGRYYHCAAGVYSTLYVLSGEAKIDDTRVILSSVESYNTKTNKWSEAGHVVHAVVRAAIVTYKNSIYVFGGADENNQCLDNVQVYNPAQGSCTLMDNPMPGAYCTMRAVLWDISAILLGSSTCFMYNFETDAWQERKQFKTGVDYFAAALDNSTVYIAGGVTAEFDRENKLVWTCADEIKSVSVLDINEDKPAVWKHHARLPAPGMIDAYVNISLPINVKATLTF